MRVVCRRSMLLAPLVLLANPLAAFAQTRARPPISPARALVTSLVIPGLAQTKLDRATSVLFVATEAIALAMYAKSSRDYAIARKAGRDSTPTSWVIDPQTGQAVLDPDTGAPQVATWSSSRYNVARIRARRTHVEDWVAVLAFNHLFAGIDAFVAAQLWDLPRNLELKASPRTATITARIPW